MNMSLYQKKYSSWNEKIAVKIAFSENIILTANHWKVIHILRFLFFKYKIIPNLRILINTLKKKYNNTYWDSIILFQLFPNGILKQALNIAGLPKNNICL
ncbi:TusE/DsrC/DsvC family sulfur relay protein [Enterobacteriaceae endosymbiont of Donacia bicoloricornis]|uniref:TusE/DsrC/DsvC family sulfur relay protein n=1 Tax=Enterobacteriaceae endosymbiont of Donacia bicoloricornis TaxID=2675772 RepID=UPI00144A185A|nr:TusE/DsrC/DsvC family sulfur relay protein [Enterobacteriaceae endosymbiont of Donacia bicoloricornis]QJC37559.1 TusE/DsrC/DsvC family sulfur relay protein [Enterobacteriaceae endosymbiont of Donacia bicoloricornis]